MPPENEETQQETTTEPTGTEATTPDYEAEIAKWKSMSRKHETQAKANAAAAKRLAELEDENKSEIQKVADKVTAAEKRAADAEAKATRYEVAANLGVQAKHMKYLAGTTRDEIEESAKGILEDFPEAYGKSGTDSTKPTRPREALRSGAVPGAKTDPNQVVNDRIRQAISGV